MAKNNTPNQQLYDLLVSKDFDLTLLDSSGRPSADPSETEIFSFDYTPSSMKDYGTVVIMLTDDQELEIYCADNVGKAMDPNDKQEWFEFLQQLRMFAKRNLLSFGIRNLNHLKYSMQGQAAIKEGLNESWSGNKAVSYNGKPNFARLMIKHNKPIADHDLRYRHIDSLFLETAEGERFKLPFKKLSGGRAMMEHVRNGGKPYDVRGQHISQMVNEISVLNRFKRLKNNSILEADDGTLVEKVNSYYETVTKNLKSLASKRGYSNYFETWDPSEINEGELVIEDVKHFFINHDEKYDGVLSLLENVQSKGTRMKEINLFESWASMISEGVWAIPDTKEKQSKLATILSGELPVGPDATNATAQLYDLYGDDDLFDKLGTLADMDANADATDMIIEHLKSVAGYPGVDEVLEKVESEQPAAPQPEQEPPTPQQTQPAEPTPDQEEPQPEQTPPEEMGDTDIDVNIDQDEEGPEIPTVSESEDCVCEEGDDECDCHEKKTLGESKMNNKRMLNEKYAYDSTLADILRKAGVVNQDNKSPNYEDGLAKYVKEPGVNEEIGQGEANPEVVPSHLLDETGEEEEGAELGLNRIKELSGMPMGEEEEVILSFGDDPSENDDELGRVKELSSFKFSEPRMADEGAVGSMVGGALGTAAGSKLGTMAADALGAGTFGKIAGGLAGAALGGWGGSKLGDKVGDMIDPDEPTDPNQEPTDEGAKGRAIGQMVGGYVGDKIGDRIGGKEEVAEGDINLSRLKELSGFLIK